MKAIEYNIYSKKFEFIWNLFKQIPLVNEKIFTKEYEKLSNISYKGQFFIMGVFGSNTFYGELIYVNVLYREDEEKYSGANIIYDCKRHTCEIYYNYKGDQFYMHCFHELDRLLSLFNIDDINKIPLEEFILLSMFNESNTV